jgi:hypothetical protein
MGAARQLRDCSARNKKPSEENNPSEGLVRIHRRTARNYATTTAAIPALLNQNSTQTHGEIIGGVITMGSASGVVPSTLSKIRPPPGTAGTVSCDPFTYAPLLVPM